MSNFTVLPSALNKQSGEINDLVPDFEAFANKVDSICSSLDISDSAMCQIKKSLDTISKNLNVYASDVRKIAVVLASTASSYTKAEKKIMGKHEVYAYKKDGKNYTVYAGKAAAEAGLSHEEGNYSDDSKFYEKAQKKRTKYKKNENVKYPDKNSTVAQVKGEAKAEATLAGASYTNKYGDVEAKIGTAEAHASATAGLYGYTKDGKQVFAPEVSAAVGASVCAATVAGKGSVGNDYFGISSSLDASAGKASASASASASVFNKNGNLDPTLKASASAEAVLAEANVSAGAKVLGVEGKVTGGVKVGVGAHADVGYTDGVIKCDVGASLGVGVNVGFEVDVGAAVKGVTSGAKAVWNTVAGWF